MNSRAVCAMISMAVACFHASLWAGVVVRDVAIQDQTPSPAQAEGTAAQRPHVLGVCALSKVVRDASGSGDVGLSVLTYANRYFNSQDEKIGYATAKVSVLKSPKHGRLEPNLQVGIDWREATYIPANRYEGNDAFVLQVQGNGQTVQLNYFVYVSEDTGADMFSNKNCKGFTWNISQSDFNPSTQDYAAWLRSSELSILIASASQTFTGIQDLAGSSVGQTTGEGANAQIRS